ncbi:MAG: hypothetical protein U0637_12860 [Phycisphaerales bacterium]
MNNLDTARRRVLWTVTGVAATAVAVVAWTTLPAWPVVGVAVATAVLAVNTLASKVRADACWGCGEKIAGLPRSEHGVMCPKCGAITERGDQRA